MLYSSYGAVLLWTAVVHQLTAHSLAQSNGPGYLGCFVDSVFTRALTWPSLPVIISRSTSVEWCFNYCLDSKAYKYAGVESETECYCGNNEDYGRRGKVADSECRNTCPDNSNQFCGGHLRIAIYQISKGVCNSSIGPPVNGSHEVTNPTHVSFNLQNSKFFGTRVRFECNTGYVIEGAEAIECIQKENIAEWSHSVPTCTASSLLPTTMTTYNTNMTTSSRAPLSSPKVADGNMSSHQQASQLTGTIIGIAAGVIASLMILLVIVTIIFKKRQKRREEIIDGANGTVNTQRADVTQGSAYEIPSRPGAVNPNLPEYDVTTDSTYEIPNQSGAVNRNPKKSDVTTSVMSAYEIPRPATNKSHQLTREQSSNDIVHEYADFKLTSLI